MLLAVAVQIGESGEAGLDLTFLGNSFNTTLPTRFTIFMSMPRTSTLQLPGFCIRKLQTRHITAPQYFPPRKMPSKMGPSKPLPYSDSHFSSPEEYIDSLLNFLGTDNLLRTLCGGVHILDFFTSDPPLYPRVLPQEWRDWFDGTDIMDILALLMREDIDQFHRQTDEGSTTTEPSTTTEDSPPTTTWRNGPLPPHSLLEYIQKVRKNLLDRNPSGSQCTRNRNRTLKSQPLSRQVSVGMSLKKVHEVGLFAAYLSTLCSSYSTTKPGREISNLVDFGSGQNYLGRALASEPYNKNIVAIESRQANAERAREFDIMAKLAVRERVLRNKKVWRETGEHIPPTPPSEKIVAALPAVEQPAGGLGKILYIDHRLESGDLKDVISKIPPLASPAVFTEDNSTTHSPPSPPRTTTAEKNNDDDRDLMVMSLHSCGNLLHHGLRSLTLNPSVRIVAMVGCCYNLLTERLGPPTYKLPSLRPAAHPRLSNLAEARDPDGFPMSERFCTAYPVSSTSTTSSPSLPDELNGGQEGAGVKLNITSRMMAVQAPSNWRESDSSSFFTRHFYRALLQRIFLDYGVVGPPQTSVEGGVSPAGHSSAGTPIIIGSLRKGCYVDFVGYVRGALAKLMSPEGQTPNVFREKMGGISDEEIRAYEKRFSTGKKNLSVIWSLMAFSAGVVEAAIVVDRYLWLSEQEEVGEAWVESVFEYAFSPRNLVVVGVKK